MDTTQYDDAEILRNCFDAGFNDGRLEERNILARKIMERLSKRHSDWNRERVREEAEYLMG